MWSLLSPHPNTHACTHRSARNRWPVLVSSPLWRLPLPALFKGCLLLLQPLDEAVLSELKTVLKSFLSQGQILKLEVKVGLPHCGVCQSVPRCGLHIMRCRGWPAYPRGFRLPT